MPRSLPRCLTQPGFRSALLLALALAILPAPPAAHTARSAGDVIRAIAGVYKKRSAHQRVQGGQPTADSQIEPRSDSALR